MVGGPAEHLQTADHRQCRHDVQFVVGECSGDRLIAFHPCLGEVGRVGFMFDEAQGGCIVVEVPAVAGVVEIDDRQSAIVAADYVRGT